MLNYFSILEYVEVALIHGEQRQAHVYMII